MQTANDIRSTFLGYFQRHDHTVVPSSPLVPRNDPTLMFANSGMVQFKNVFTGAEKRDYVRATTAQKCVRAGGKHNDLDNVGYTARHHTFFEMLGNFSFGDYFKERAIELAWNLITKEFGLPADKLLATVYHTDDVAFNLWRKISGLPESRIIRIPTSDNFWAMGDTGPCGPCSEIFFDHGDKIPGGPPGSPDADGDRFIEIWNLVFMQYEQVTKDTRIDLPRPSIDTGMGLERIAAIMQGKHDNYDIDMMRVLIEASADASHTDPDGPFKNSHRIVADHLRTSGFLIADGVLPSNEGRGYVLRRIMRRAMRHAQIMGCKDPLMYRLVPALVREMGEAYPELGRAQPLITETLKLEEERFRITLERGLKLLDEETAKLGAGGTLAGDVAFRLYDTFGFPLDLTQDALRARDIKVDVAGFEVSMDKQRAEARKAWAGSGEAATEAVWFPIREKVGATEFLGYETEAAEARIVALVVDGKPVDEAGPGTKVLVVANQTPFYGESGGQVGDTGTITIPGKAKLTVTDTQKKVHDLVVHYATVDEGKITTADSALFTVDGERRTRLRAHHSATHLLFAAMRQQLGAHVSQKGSLVAPDRLRFDVSHPKQVSADEQRHLEDAVNAGVRANVPVITRLMTPQAATQAGAIAEFGEKYGDEVRVVAMGDGAEKITVDLCGGTHVRRTGDIGLFKIIGEGAVGSGVRRIEAVTGAAAEAWIDQQVALLANAAEALKVPAAEVPARIATLADSNRKLEKEIADLRRKLATGEGSASASPDRTVKGIKLAARKLDGVPAKDLKGMADDIKKQIGSGVVALVSDAEGKASLVIAVTEDLAPKVSAVDLVRAGAAALGGKGGGGRPDMAQAGGPDVGRGDEAIAAIEQALSQLVA
ncbi:MAG TPA: alanine--tRNA ligase [Magnetospirillaceae bacterium]|jgi:alanyl-tRNA synthetase